MQSLDGDSQFRVEDMKDLEGCNVACFSFLSVLGLLFGQNFSLYSIPYLHLCATAQAHLTNYTSTSLHQYIHVKPVSEPIQSFMVLQPPPL